jgi:hypothetical protein
VICSVIKDKRREREKKKKEGEERKKNVGEIGWFLSALFCSLSSFRNSKEVGGGGGNKYFIKEALHCYSYWSYPILFILHKTHYKIIA